MRLRSTVQWFTVVAVLAFFAVLAMAAKEYIAPRAYNAKVYPAHDEHPQEHLIVAADPYDTQQKAEIFTLPYQERGMLPIFLVISNDGNEPASLVDMKVQLVTGRREKLFPADKDDLRRRFSQVKNRPGEPSRLPIPMPRRVPSGSISNQALDEIEKAPFQARAVEPQATQSGFIFFDVTDVSSPLAGGSVYVTGVKDSRGQEVMYFEIPLEKYLNSRSGRSQ